MLEFVNCTRPGKTGLVSYDAAYFVAHFDELLAASKPLTLNFLKDGEQLGIDFTELVRRVGTDEVKSLFGNVLLEPTAEQTSWAASVAPSFPEMPLPLLLGFIPHQTVVYTTFTKRLFDGSVFENYELVGNGMGQQTYMNSARNYAMVCLPLDPSQNAELGLPEGVAFNIVWGGTVYDHSLTTSAHSTAESGYMLTDFTMNSGDLIEVEYDGILSDLSQIPGYTGEGFTGTNDNDGRGTFYINVMESPSIPTNGEMNFRCGIRGVTDNIFQYIPHSLGVDRIKVRMNTAGKVWFNNVEYGDSGVTPETMGTFPDVKFPVFGYYSQNAGRYYRAHVAKLWGFKASIDGTLVHEFRPTAEGSTLYSATPAPANCFWDIVTRKYITSVGLVDYTITQESS